MFTTKPYPFVAVAFFTLCFGLPPKLLTLNDSKFTFQYPDTWACVKDTGQVDYYVYPPEDNDPSFNENIVVRHTDLAGNKTTHDEFAAQSRKGINELFKNVVFYSDKTINTKTESFREMIYSGNYNGVNYKMKQVFYLKYGYSYILIYTAKMTTYDRNIKEATQIMESFKPKIPKK
jgi:hypothetical protein